MKLVSFLYDHVVGGNILEMPKSICYRDRSGQEMVIEIEGNVTLRNCT